METMQNRVEPTYAAAMAYRQQAAKPQRETMPACFNVVAWCQVELHAECPQRDSCMAKQF